MFIIKYKKIFFAIALLLVGASITAIATKGFVMGVDFTGGSVLEVTYENRPLVEQVRPAVIAVEPSAVLLEVGDSNIKVRTETIDQVKKDAIIAALSSDEATATEVRFNTIGPSVGQELRTKALWSMIIVGIAMILFIAFTFRKVSEPISSWVYGLIAILVLVHDVIIPAGYFAFSGIQVDTLFVVGLLTILGISINDTIIVFDRIRENLIFNKAKHVTESFAHTVGKSIEQTFTRSIMTSVTLLVALGALYLYGPEATRNLSITMFLGMFFGTYSSIFIAAPLLVVWNDYKNKQ